MTSKFIAKQKHKYHIQKLILDKKTIKNKSIIKFIITYVHVFKKHICTAFENICARLPKTYMHGFREHMCMPSKNTMHSLVIFITPSFL